MVDDAKVLRPSSDLASMNTKNILSAMLLIFATTACSKETFAFGQFKNPPENNDSPSNGSSGSTGGGNSTVPTAPATPTPKPNPPAAPNPAPTPTPTPPKPAPVPPTSPSTPNPPADRNPASDGSLRPQNFNVFSEVAYPVGVQVDNRFSSYRELLVQRSQASHRVDSCVPELERNYRFADRIAFAVDQKMQPTTAQLGYVASAFNMPSSVSSHAKTSLISHPLCTVSSSSLQTTLGGKNIPSAATINKVNNFVNLMNSYRSQALRGDANGYVNASKLWSKFFMCLSYSESLTTADTKKSVSVAEKYAPSDYRKPASVKFYEDPYQNEASRLNIGLFQFTPTAGGNVQACIREWNVENPDCKVSQTASQAEMIRILGSSMQTFNAFCGVAKVTGTFAVQVNSSSARNTHPSNVKSNGALKASGERCVSPHFLSGRAYNHFGPLQNTTGDTLDTLMNCALAK